ncbi:rod shape-determining protein MreC [Pedococcus sp. 5OH_020]|uniref:rod shape-determining protein MreC n=1 Tax=Pedococcus sp. 5OH_020 TaxID=2989814 RepID=UPI0022E9B41D|nr:rod shape-determining protein MreC [Pedococcus sp. 5OH_020]
MSSPSSSSHRRLLVLLVAVTLVVLALDVAGSRAPLRVRALGGAVFGPIERLVASSREGDTVARAGAVRTATDADLRTADDAAVAGVAALRKAPETTGRRFVAARVVALGRQGAAGPERLTIDAGSRDRVRVGAGVVSADGVVGRVVSVSPWTADVLLLGAPGLQVAVRVGSAGTLGAVGPERASHPGAAGLQLSLVQLAPVSAGDIVTTLGSIGGAPFEPGLRVGTVRQLDTRAGSLVPAGTVTPSVDVARLDVVGVLLPRTRTTPRPAATGGG